MEHSSIPIAKMKKIKVAINHAVHDTSYAVHRLPVAAELKLPFRAQKEKGILDSATFIKFVWAGESSEGGWALKDAYLRLRREEYSRETAKSLLTAARDFSNSAKFIFSAYFPIAVADPLPNIDDRCRTDPEPRQPRRSL